MILLYPTAAPILFRHMIVKNRLFRKLSHFILALATINSLLPFFDLLLETFHMISRINELSNDIKHLIVDALKSLGKIDK